MVVAALAAGGCGGALQADDAGAQSSGSGDANQATDMAPAALGCGGQISLAGRTPDGMFSATGVYAEVATDIPRCHRGLHFLITGAASAALFFDIRLPGADAGSSLAPGPYMIDVQYSGPYTPNQLQFYASTTGTVTVASADEPPFDVCEAADGFPQTLETGGISFAIAISGDGFEILGRVSTRYCTCSSCYDTL